MAFRKLMSVLGLACGCATTPPARLAEPVRPPSPAVAVLKAGQLWGKDFPALLAYARAWNRAGEAAFVVFPDRAVGATPYRSANDAKPAYQGFSRTLEERPAPATADFTDSVARVRAPPFQPSVIRLPEDGSNRLAVTGKGLEFLAPGLTIRKVHETLGPPESVKRQAVQEPDGGERRPVILTLHRYAGGAVIFAESEWAPPGTVDRAVLDVRSVNEAVFGRTP